MNKISLNIVAVILGCCATFTHGARAVEPAQLSIAWDKNFLTVRGDFPGEEVKIMYLEAYCRPGSTDRDWGQTVIKHEAKLVSISDSGKVIRLRDKLEDGVIVEHTITAGADEVDFQVIAHNPTDAISEAHWAQPCMRVEKFTGAGNADARELVPAYARKCFLFTDGKMTRLPTEPWADQARYTPGQVYCPKSVDRKDVNPRPLSSLVPSSGLCGCYSADDKQILAVAWEPYQELFQGVVACMHSDFRIGGLAPGQTKTIRGKLYIVPANAEKLVSRFEKDFPNQQ